MIEPLVRCLHCGWVHVGVRQPEAASDYCFRCKDFGFHVITVTNAAAPPAWVGCPRCTGLKPNCCPAADPHLYRFLG